MTRPKTILTYFEGDFPGLYHTTCIINKNRKLLSQKSFLPPDVLNHLLLTDYQISLV